MYTLIITTTNDMKIAQNIAKILTNKEYSPCVQILNNLNSIYKWKGEIINEPCTLPHGTLPSKRKKWFVNTSFEICAPSRVSYIGFALSWAAVVLMIFGFMYIMRPWLQVSETSNYWEVPCFGSSAVIRLKTLWNFSENLHEIRKITKAS